jgi:hypothetical protein
MPQTLPALEGERTPLLADISKLGDFRSGSITSVVRRCGKPNCHCARPQGAGHGPDFRLTDKLHGKTRTESRYRHGRLATKPNVRWQSFASSNDSSARSQKRTRRFDLCLSRRHSPRHRT